MTKQSEVSNVQNLTEANTTAESPAVKKTFVEPELSAPVDVLEATTFFQGVTTSPAPTI